MPPSNFTDDLPTEREPSVLRGDSIEYSYIWSTTGSGKTLTSFKASTLLKDNPDSHRVLQPIHGRSFYSTQHMEAFAA